MTNTSMTGPVVKDGPELKAAVSHGNEEYRFYQIPNGNPPGQIKTYVVGSKLTFEKRVPFDKLPTTALQEHFVALTGKKAEDIGVTVTK